MSKLNFEKLPDGTCVITFQGINNVGQPYLRQEIIKQISVFDALEYSEKQNKELREALYWFCNRVDAGEVRSNRTYARFKELLKK